MTHTQHQGLGGDGAKGLGSLAPRLMGLGLVLGVAGLALACFLGLRDPETQGLFFHAYLVVFVFYLSITLGALFFVLLHHLSRAGWSVTVRRVAEALAANVWLMAVLYVPILLGIRHLYEWAAPGAAAHDPVLAGKASFLNPTAFIVRGAAYFVIWIVLAWFFRSRSIRQDATGDIRLSVSMERISAPGMIAYALTLTFAGIDLLMSLNPHWASTVFGVYLFAGSVVSFLVVLALLTMWLQANGRMLGAVTTEHYHDLAKLTFAFVIFWGYIAFSQYMLIWYANLPEETQFFIPRQLGPWAWVSIVLLVCHLLIPFVGLMSRNAKRRLIVFSCWGVWLLAAHLLDLFWLVMPNLFIKKIPEAVGAAPGTPLPEALKMLLGSRQDVYQIAAEHASFNHAVALPLEARSLLLLAALVVGVGGLYLASTTWFLSRAALVPQRDPRLSESLAFENV